MLHSPLVLVDMQSEQAKKIYECTGGHPILIGIATDTLNYNIHTLEDLLEADLADFERFLIIPINNLRNPTNWVILFMTHIYHRFNFGLLTWMLQKAGLQALIPNAKLENFGENLLTLSFVRGASTGNEFVLHDEMQRLVATYCWPVQDPEAFRYRRELSRIVIQFYEKEIIQASSDQQQ